MKFYVYELIDPRDGSVFYVGKASNRSRRFSGHIRDAKRGYGTKKYDRIREILSQGYKVIRHKVAHFYDEQDAFEFEKEQIAHYGLSNLTNMTPGGQIHGFGHVPFWPEKAGAEANELIRFAWPYMDREGRI